MRATLLFVGLALTLSLKQAAVAAVDALSPNDCAAVVTFSELVTLRADWSAATAATRSAFVHPPLQ